MVRTEELQTADATVAGEESVISADSHSVEPSGLWATRLPHKFRDAYQEFVADGRGPGGSPLDPDERLRTVAQDGISAEVLYPNTLHGFHILDAAFQEAYFRVYNGWIAEYCVAAPESLAGLAQISLYDSEHAVHELERGDKQVRSKTSLNPLPISLLPSEYFRRQVFASFLDEPVAGVLLAGWGTDNCMWGSDYPHPGNGTWPNSRAIIARDLGHLPPESRSKVLWQNAAKLYGLSGPAHVRNPVP